MPSPLRKAIISRVLFAFTLALVLGSALAVAAVGKTAAAPLSQAISARSYRSIGMQRGVSRADTAQSGIPLTPTDTTRLFLPSVFRGFEAHSSILTERERHGFVATLPGWPQTFDVARLRAGWYVDATQPACSDAPEGMAPALLISVHAGYAVDAGQLGPLVDNHPASIWLIGNEPDCIWQDNVWPEEYARIYHDLYSFIKSRDPASQLSPGGVVQPTPLRLEWLDRVLAAYSSQYGESLPVDVWNIHNAILNEERGGWGAGIPPGIEATKGVSRDINDNDDMAIFTGQIWAFRQWMANRGYAGYPLIVTEYGILMPDDYGFGPERVNAFMTATFEFFKTTTHPNLGAPRDGHRLVQRWAWFSLDVQPWDPITGDGFNGNLFDPGTAGITSHGLHYAGHTTSFPPLGYVDLRPDGYQTLPASTVTSAPAITLLLQVDIVNEGTLDSGPFLARLEYSGPTAGTLEQAVENVPPASARPATYLLTDLLPGSYTFSVSVDPTRQVLESVECNNQLTGTFLAAADPGRVPAPGNQSALGSLSAKAAVGLAAPSSGTHSFTIGGLGGSSAAAAPTLVSELGEWVRPATTSGFTEYEVPTPDSSPAQLALDSQGGVWLTEQSAGKIARFEPQDETWHEHEIPTPGSQPWGLALAGSGDVWFAETGLDRIGRLVVATGTITEYSGLTLGSEPWSVAVGGDGMVWFTERAGGRIGRLNPASGVVTEYPVPFAGEPVGLVVSGSNLWFTQTAPQDNPDYQFGHFDIKTGHFEPFLRPPGSRPQDIVLSTLSTQGKPWFSESGGDRIVLFSPSSLGFWVEIPVRTSDSEPYGIAMEGDVAVWFTERVGNRLGRYDGRIPPSEYLLPEPNSQPTDIVVDGDGCAWYTAPGANRIGRLCLQQGYLPLILKDSSP